jgi:acyl carrier protein
MMSTCTPETIAEALERFIRDRFKVPSQDQVFSRTIRLWDEGYVDSIGVAEMIAFLESTFSVKISNDVVFSPDFTHIDGIARLVVHLQAGSSPADPSPVFQTGTAA